MKRGRRRKGAGLGDLLKKANAFVKKNNLISTGANLLGALGVPNAGNVGSVAGAMGYGRRYRKKRRKRGGCSKC